MVFPGRFSTGCMRCRQRKLKCDETKPTCRRCHVHGRPCPGYTDQFHFRDPLLSSSFNEKKKATSPTAPPTAQPIAPPRPAVTRCKSSKLLQQVKNCSNDDHSAWNLARRVQFPSTIVFMSPSIDPCDDRSSLNYFIHRFVASNSADSFPSNMTCLPSLFNHDAHGLLEVTTLSVAQIAAYNHVRCDRLRVQSYRNYGRAIGMLQDTISSGQGITDDKVLAAVLLLCTFKDISGEGFDDPSEHVPGLYILLEMRGIEQLATGRGFELYVLSLLRLHAYSFLHNDITYSDPGGLEHFLGHLDPLMRAMSLTTKMMRLRHALIRCTHNMQQSSVDALSPGSPRDHQEAVDMQLLEDFFQILYEFDLWDEEAAVYWRHTFEGRAVPLARGQVATGSHYYDPETACTIILLRSSRLILLISMLGYNDRMQLDHRDGPRPVDARWADFLPALQHDVRATIDDMLSCVPYALAEVDSSGQPVPTPNDGAGALIILQPLKVITSCQYATSQQLLVCGTFLARMERAIGIKSATV